MFDARMRSESATREEVDKVEIDNASGEMTEAHLSTLLRLRLIVGFLGERAQFGWWPTAFFEPASRLFLEPVFSKTTRLAQYHGVVEAARRLHDEHLSVGTFHLFRLPEEVEQDLHTMLLALGGDGSASQAPQNRQAGLDSLKDLAGMASRTGIGPMVVGNINQLASVDTLTSIAAIYFSAFSKNAKSYPYLTA